MMRTALVAGALLLGAGAVMAQQDVAVTQQNLMKVALGKPMYGVLGKILKGDAAYDQATVDAALNDMETEENGWEAAFMLLVAHEQRKRSVRGWPWPKSTYVL